jgi:hypothetical protein
MKISTHWRSVRSILGICILGVAGFICPTVFADPPRSAKDKGQVQKNAEAKPCKRVGQIFILGNINVPDSIILEQCPLFPGGEYSRAVLRKAEQNLAKLGLFVVDRKRGIRPSVKPLKRDDDNVFVDIAVTVQERPDVKQLLLLRQGMSFFIDCQTWGLVPAIDRATGFSDVIVEFVGLSNKRCTGYAPDPAIAP